MVDQLAEQVSRIVGRPMDRSRPLWEVYVIDGLHSGRWALLTKYHHATIDGAAGQLMLNILTDTEPDAPAPGAGPSWEPEPLPSNIDLLRRTAGQPGKPPVQRDAGAGPDRSSARRRRRHPQREQRGRQRRCRHQGHRPTRQGGRGRTSRCRSRRHRRRRGTRRSPATAASPCAPRPWRTSSGSRTQPAAPSTTSSWRFVRARCASTCWPTTRCRTVRCGRWCRCRSAPARKTTRGPTGCRPSSPICRPTATDPVERVARCRAGDARRQAPARPGAGR